MPGRPSRDLGKGQPVRPDWVGRACKASTPARSPGPCGQARMDPGLSVEPEFPRQPSRPIPAGLAHPGRPGRDGEPGRPTGPKKPPMVVERRGVARAAHSFRMKTNGSTSDFCQTTRSKSPGLGSGRRSQLGAEISAPGAGRCGGSAGNGAGTGEVRGPLLAWHWLPDRMMLPVLRLGPPSPGSAARHLPVASTSRCPPLIVAASDVGVAAAAAMREAMTSGPARVDAVRGRVVASASTDNDDAAGLAAATTTAAVVG
mmetsp:Transcript_4357/g.12107  ORF Transcript_4357/g.12107 Transcript_4357/m.12107 type:complete len:258 (+) Transcript_4357:340-1113(+)